MICKPMRIFFASIFLALCFLSCSPRAARQLTEVAPTEASYKNLYFSDLSKDYVYKAKIEVYGNSFGGIWVVKKLNQAHYRIVFTTEFGNKIFDFELENADFKVNFILPDLKKKLIINTLKKDFQILLKEDNQVYRKYEAARQIVYQSKYNNRYNFHFTDADSQTLNKIVHRGKVKEKIVMHIEATTPTKAKKISIQHQNIKLQIDLKAF